MIVAVRDFLVANDCRSRNVKIMYVYFNLGLLLRMFVTLYDLEIIEEDAFISWKEDVNEQHPGKGRALFQVRAAIHR